MGSDALKYLAKMLQTAAAQVTGNVLEDDDAITMAFALMSVKSGDKWLEDQEVMPFRCKYFFEPHMTENQSQMVFVTYPLFLRDILESQKISDHLHSPVVFMTPELSGFIFKEYSVQVCVDQQKLKRANPKQEWLSVGGLLIAPQGNISIDGAVLRLGIGPHEDQKFRLELFRRVKDIQRDAIMFTKTAQSQPVPGQPEVWESAEHERDLLPGTRLLDKEKRTYAVVKWCEPGKEGYVEVEYAGGKTLKLRQDEFDIKFTRI